MNTVAHLLAHLAQVSDTDKNAPPLTEFATQLDSVGATLCLGVRPHNERFPAGAAPTRLHPGSATCGLYAWLEFRQPSVTAPVIVLSVPPVLEVAA